MLSDMYGLVLIILELGMEPECVYWYLKGLVHLVGRMLAYLKDYFNNVLPPFVK